MGCEGVTCEGQGACVMTDGEARCECEAGYHANGAHCVEDDDALFEELTAADLVIHYDFEGESTEIVNRAQNDFSGQLAGTLNEGRVTRSSEGRHGAGLGSSHEAERTWPRGVHTAVDDDFNPLFDHFTVEVWMRFDALPPEDGDRISQLGIFTSDFAHLFLNHGDSFSCGAHVSNAEDLDFQTADGFYATSSVTAIPEIEQGDWFHVACVYDGASVRLYLNGNLHEGNRVVSTHTGESGDNPQLLPDSALPYRAPAPHWGEVRILDTFFIGGHELEGNVDGFSLWRAARSQEQVCEASGGDLIDGHCYQ